MTTWGYTPEQSGSPQNEEEYTQPRQLGTTAWILALLVVIASHPVSASQSSWGQLKAQYRGGSGSLTTKVSPVPATVAVGRQAAPAQLVYGGVSYLYQGQTLDVSVARGTHATVFFIPCRSGTWTLHYRQTYLLGEQAFITPMWGHAGCSCYAGAWNKWAVWTAWIFGGKATIYGGASDIGFKFDIYYPPVSYSLGSGNAKMGDANVELTIQ